MRVRFDLSRPIWVEAESAKVGDLQVPSRVWRDMQDAAVCTVSLPVHVRVIRILEVSMWA